MRIVADENLAYRLIKALRLSGMETDEKIVRILDVIRNYGEELKDCFTVVDAVRVRLRKQ